MPDAVPSLELPCPTCGRTLRYRSEHRGRKARCPGCQNIVAIPRQEPLDPLVPDAAWFPYDWQSPLPTAVSIPPAAAEEPPPANKSRKPVAKPTWTSLTVGAWTYCWRLDVLPRWCFLSGIWFVVGIFELLALVFSTLGMFGAIGFVSFGILGAIIVLFGLAYLSSSGLTIMEQAAYDADECEWPDIAMADRVGPFVYMVWLLSLSLSPGWALGYFLYGGSEHAWVAGPLMCASGYLLFPIWLLSTLQTGSAFELISTELWRGVGKNLASWLWFYFVTGMVAFVLTIGFFVGVFTFPKLTAIASGPVMAWGGIFYFRLLGRLAWIMGHEKEKKRKRKRHRDTADDE